MVETNFLLRKTYEEWLKDHLKKNPSQKSIKCYLMQDTYEGFLYFDIIASFLYHYERTYAYSVLNKWFESIKNDKNKKTYWRKYKQFIQDIDIRNEIINCNETHKVIDPKDLKSVRASFNKTDLAQIDGMDSLINCIGDGIIKLAIESSYFFDKKIASNQEENVDENVYYNKDGIRICNIIIDGNGNAKVCQMINEYTGYNLAYKLENKPFVNFIISHIWGRAIDPRYFTNFWNIVLVPAWVNHLLDKDVDDEEGVCLWDVETIEQDSTNTSYAATCNLIRQLERIYANSVHHQTNRDKQVVAKLLIIAALYLYHFTTIFTIRLGTTMTFTICLPSR